LTRERASLEIYTHAIKTSEAILFPLAEHNPFPKSRKCARVHNTQIWNGDITKNLTLSQALKKVITP